MKNMNFLLHPYVMSLKKGVGPRVETESIRQSYRSEEPDPHQNVTDSQHCLLVSETRASQKVTRIHQDLVETINWHTNRRKQSKVSSRKKKQKKWLDIVEKAFSTGTQI